MEFFIIDNWLADPAARRALAIAQNFSAWPAHGLAATNHGLEGLKVRQEFFRLGLELDAQPVHVDWPMSRTTAVAYLNPHGSGGTAFWRHRRTGLTRITADVDQATRAELAADGMDESKWEMWLGIGMQFNRLLVFDSQLLHSPLPRAGWGQTKEDGRLVQTWWLDEDLGTVKGRLIDAKNKHAAEGSRG